MRAASRRLPCTLNPLRASSGSFVNAQMSVLTLGLSSARRVAFRLSRLSQPRLPTPCARVMSGGAASAFDHKAWTASFLDAVKEVPNATDPAQSADVLRSLVRTGLLSFTDMRDAPEKFFLAHRLLATVGLGGFGVRFTVQFNLFAGSIVGLGGPEQVEGLKSIQANGQLGCFLLTEMQAGVLSGLIVETTCDWDPASQEFVLHTPSDKAAKNWISQGYTAELGVVIADLRVGGKSHGPHAFLMELRDASGTLLPGIRVEDMGTKTVADDLVRLRVRRTLTRSLALTRWRTTSTTRGCGSIRCGYQDTRPAHQNPTSALALPAAAASPRCGCRSVAS